jgi:hypothetical protein
MADPLEIRTEHRCHLGRLTDDLATFAGRGERGEELAGRARVALGRLLASGEFERCCLPVYLAAAPERFDRELQVPVASSPVARLDTRVLLWPVGAEDKEHPHADGWTVFAAVRGDLTVSEQRDGERRPERAPRAGVPEVLSPEEGVTHHVHNRGSAVGLSVHVFGR